MWQPKLRNASYARRASVVKQRRVMGLSKRRRFLLVSIILSLVLLFIQNMPTEQRLIAFFIYFILSYGLSAWSLIKDLNGIEWMTNLILPSFFPVSVGLFYFLLPQQAITRVIVMILFAIGMYALLLTANIFGVASIRTIQLLRAARAVGFLFTVLTSSFLFFLVLSFKFSAGITAVLMLLLSYPLFLQGLWSSLLENRVSKNVSLLSLAFSVLLTELTIGVLFWPIDIAMGSVFLAMIVYVFLGLGQHLLEDRLFKKTIQEYLGFGLIVFVIVMISTIFQWLA